MARVWSLWTSTLSSPGVLAVSMAVASFFRASSTLGRPLGSGSLGFVGLGWSVIPRRMHLTYMASGVR